MQIRQGVSQEQLISTDKNVNKALEEKIVNLIDIEIPETLVDEQTKTKFAQMMSGESDDDRMMSGGLCFDTATNRFGFNQGIAKTWL